MAAKITYQKSARQSGVKPSQTSPRRTVYVIRPDDHCTVRSRLSPHDKYICQGNATGEIMAISNFHIQYDSKDRLKPGDEVSGKVIMDVWSPVQVSCVDFLVTGRGTVRIFSSSTTFVEKPRSEIYINKKIQLIGPQNGQSLALLAPGRYVSSFRYALPENIPPTVHQFDMGHGYVFDISYCVQANLCNTVRSKSASIVTKILKAVRKPFIVMPPYDWKSYPGAMESIVHKEHVALMGSSTGDPTSVTLNLNRGVFTVGDAITILTQVHCPQRRRVHSITAELEQQLTFRKDMLSKFRQNMVSAEDDRHLRIFIGQEHTMNSQFKLHIPKNVVPSYLPHCHMLKVEYNMKLTVSFKKFGGNLLIRVPLVIMPANYGDSINSGITPLFNKPVMKFPYFSKGPEHILEPNGNATSVGSQREQSSSNSSKEDIVANLKGQITTKYEPPFSCSGCCLACLGVGIYDQDDTD